MKFMEQQWILYFYCPNNTKKISINRTETDKMAAQLALCKSRFISIVDVTYLTLPVSAALY